jgi:drug/metabolite transporter (DMT)-like permease
LAAAVSWGSGDFAGGITTRLSSSVTAVFMAQAVGLVLATLMLLASGESAPGPDALVWGAAAGAAGTLGLGAFYLALSRGTMGLVAPATALLAAAWPATITLLRGTPVGPLTVVGMLIALVAIAAISLPDPRLGSPSVPTYHGSRGREWLLILAAALGFGSFFLLVDASHGAGGAVWWPLFMVKASGAAILVVTISALAVLGRSSRLRPGRAAFLLGCAAGCGDFGGNLFFVLASGTGELAVVIVLTSLYPVTTAVLARLVLHERLSPARILGVLLAVLGVILIGLGS